MASSSFSLKSNKGQILLEGLLFVCFIFGILFSFNIFQEKANQEIEKHRIKNLTPSAFKKATNPRWYNL